MEYSYINLITYNRNKKKRSDYFEPVKCDHCDYKSKNKTMLTTHIIIKI